MDIDKTTPYFWVLNEIALIEAHDLGRHAQVKGYWIETGCPRCKGDHVTVRELEQLLPPDERLERQQAASIKALAAFHSILSAVD